MKTVKGIAMTIGSSPVSAMPRPNKERGEFLPTLSLEERNRRWRAVRDLMAFQGLDCLLLIGNDVFFDMGMVNFRYLTHIGSKLGGYCIFPLEGEPAVFTGLPHTNKPYSIYVHSQSWVHDIRAGGLLACVEELKTRGCERNRIGLVGFGMTVWNSNISHTDHLKLQQSLPHAQIIEVTGAIDQLRVIKSEEEIQMLLRAGQLANKMIAAMRDGCRPGRRECEVWADMLHATISSGGEPTVFNLLSSGPCEGDPVSVEHLLHGAEQPGSPSMRQLKKGDLVVTELHSNWGGYLAAAEHSVFLGSKAPAPLRRIHDVAVECFHSGVEKMRPGTTVRELAEAFRAPCEKAGLDYLELGFHGHGLASPEIPTVVYKPDQPIISGRGIMDMELQENMVLGTNVDIYDPRWRADVGIQLGDMVQVTRTGPRIMCDIPLEFSQNPA